MCIHLVYKEIQAMKLAIMLSFVTSFLEMVDGLLFEHEFNAIM